MGHKVFYLTVHSWMTCCCLGQVDEIPSGLEKPPINAATVSRSNETSVTALAVNSVTEEGSTHPVVVRVSPNPSGETSVGVLEQFSSGTGDQWRASAWIAAFCASRFTDSLISDHEFLLRTTGHIDGPSAGMMITAVMIAMIKGDSTVAHAAMTGTINPDGSIGPVGGIPAKLEAAAKAGIKKFGYPTGQRLSQDHKASKENDSPVFVDLKERAKELDMEAVEIRDIFDAYRLMTTKTLFRSSPIAEEDLEISVSLAQRVRGSSQSLRSSAKQRLDTLKRKFEGYSDKQTKDSQLEELVPLYALIEISEAYEREGAITLGYHWAGVSDQRSRVAELSYELGGHRQNGDLATFEKVGNDQFEAAYERLEALRTSLKSNVDRPTVGGKVDAIHSFCNYWQGRAILDAGLRTYRFAVQVKKNLIDLEKQYAGKKTVTSEQKDAAKALANDYVALHTQMSEQFAMAQSLGDAAANWASFAQEGGKSASGKPELYKKLGNAYSVAAGAGLQWFRSIVVKSQAEARATTEEVINVRLILNEPEYSPVLSAANFAEGSSSESEKKEKLLPLDQLASGMYAFHGLAGLINKHYNFRGEFSDPDPQSLRLSKRKALGSTLDLARKRVLEECSKVQSEVGFIPDSIKINYDLANILRDGSDSSKLSALKAYWKCHFLCDLARRLGD
jgi:hypothetical protein